MRTWILGECPMCGKECVDVLADVPPEQALCRDCMDAAPEWDSRMEREFERVFAHKPEEK